MNTKNRNMNNDTNAVSPVIGVILMVAITVVLAAVVYVMVSRLADGSGEIPVEIGLSRSGDGSFTVTSFSESVAYDNLTIKDNGSTTIYTVNGFTPSDGQVMEAGDIIRPTDLEDGQHEISFIYRDVLIYQAHFTV